MKKKLFNHLDSNQDHLPHHPDQDRQDHRRAPRRLEYSHRLRKSFFSAKLVYLVSKRSQS